MHPSLCCCLWYFSNAYVDCFVVLYMRCHSFKGLSTTRALRTSLWKSPRQQSQLFDGFIALFQIWGLTKETGNSAWRDIRIHPPPPLVAACVDSETKYAPSCCWKQWWKLQPCGFSYIVHIHFICSWSPRVDIGRKICSTSWYLLNCLIHPIPPFESFPIPQTDVDLWPHQTSEDIRLGKRRSSLKAISLLERTAVAPSQGFHQHRCNRLQEGRSRKKQ